MAFQRHQDRRDPIDIVPSYGRKKFATFVIGLILLSKYAAILIDASDVMQMTQIANFVRPQLDRYRSDPDETFTVEKLRFSDFLWVVSQPISIGFGQIGHR